jgi:hypothetical protein
MLITEIATDVVSVASSMVTTPLTEPASEPIGLLVWGGTLIALSLALRFVYTRRRLAAQATSDRLKGLVRSLTQPAQG